MKKVLILATALTLALSSGAFAQATGAGTSGQGAGNASGDNASPGSPQSNNPTGNQERHSTGGGNMAPPPSTMAPGK
jgi:hypothetical protein